MNYQNTFILVSEDCPSEEGIIFDNNYSKKPIHQIQYQLLTESPYKYTQEDIQFLVYAERNQIRKTDHNARNEFLNISQPCLRSSALAKKYGWGIHFNSEGKAAIYSKDSDEYRDYAKSENIKVTKALRNKRAKT